MKLRETLGFLRKLTSAPQEVQPADVAALRAVGVSPAAIEQAIHVCALFNIIDRIADALGFEVPPPETMRRSARILLKRGYRF